MHGATMPGIPHGATCAPRARGRRLPRFRVVCHGGEGEITLRAKAEDKYEAFEQIIMFLRKKGFDYEIVRVEPS